MRVAHVITRLIVGGAQENTIASVLGLQQRPGLELHLISGPTTGPEGSLESALASHPGLLTLVPELIRPVHPWMDLRAWRSLTRLFQRARPDIVHTHSGKAGVIGRLAAKRAGVPIIIHTIHGPSFGPFQGAMANLVFRSAEQVAAKVTTHFVVVAEAMKQQYLQARIGRPEQFTRIFSGFALEPFLSAKNEPELRARLGLCPEHIVVGKIARLFKLKGHTDLFRVANDVVREHPQVRFLLVGDGPLRPSFERELRSRGLEKYFVFAGLVAPATVPKLVGVMDFLVHLSSREGLARALPQALAAGKPVIAYDCDGAREICLQNQTGFLVSRGDLSDLRARIGQLAGDAELRARLGTNGRRIAQENFAVTRMVAELHALYLRLADARSPSKRFP